MKGVSHGFSSLLSPRVSKDKWNSPNGLEEKEIWMEEDRLFNVQGKPQIALVLLLKCDACYCRVHVASPSVPVRQQHCHKSECIWFYCNRLLLCRPSCS